MKKLLGSLFVSALLITSSTFALYGNEQDIINKSIESSENQVQILKDYKSSASQKTKKNSRNIADNSAADSISLIGCTEDGSIIVGITDFENGNIKNEILNLQGLDEEKIEFIEFKLLDDSNGFATELPADYEQRKSARGLLLGMGTIIDMGGGQFATLGSPVDGSGSHFFTANHGVKSVGQVVKIANISTTIGEIVKVSFTNKTDISRVDVGSYGNKVTSNLTGYRGSTPAVGSSVTAYTGFSGTLKGTILYSSVSVYAPSGNLLDDVIVVPMNVVNGDSGSALTYGTSAIGILSVRAELNNKVVGVFTKLTNYY